MSMRISSAIAISILLTACGGEGQQQALPADPLVEAEVSARSELAESGIIYCAVNGSTEFRSECQLDRTQGDEGLFLTIRHPDGGFRRLLVTNDGRGVVAADGADPAIVEPVSDREVEVAIAGDYYRLPATVR